MKFYEYFYGAGLLLIVLSGGLLSIIQLRQIKSLKDWLFMRYAFSELSPKDIRMAKKAGILFIFGSLLIIVGAIIK
jgi:NADH:ubiquinone oxidoreductase subunit 5 (subunit L)/multisubunit Na+/H+ antiporter MnhA subunit